MVPQKIPWINPPLLPSHCKIRSALGSQVCLGQWSCLASQWGLSGVLRKAQVCATLWLWLLFCGLRKSGFRWVVDPIWACLLFTWYAWWIAQYCSIGLNHIEPPFRQVTLTTTWFSRHMKLRRDPVAVFVICRLRNFSPPKNRPIRRKEIERLVQRGWETERIERKKYNLPNP
jgi:hypothetical protein